MIRKNRTKIQLTLILRFLLRMGGQRYFDFCHSNPLHNPLISHIPPVKGMVFFYYTLPPPSVKYAGRMVSVNSCIYIAFFLFLML